MDRTLIVDDSPTMRRMVMASLREVCAGGFAEAASGLEAIEQLALGPVALMVLDLNMPDMHGLEVLKFVRGHDAFRRLPVIVLTTRGDEASRAAALAAGASALPDQAVRAPRAGGAGARAGRSRYRRCARRERPWLTKAILRRIPGRLLRRVRGAPRDDPPSAARARRRHRPPAGPAGSARGAVPQLPFDQGHLRDGGAARRRDAGAPHGELPARAAAARGAV